MDWSEEEKAEAVLVVKRLREFGARLQEVTEEQVLDVIATWPNAPSSLSTVPQPAAAFTSVVAAVVESPLKLAKRVHDGMMRATQELLSKPDYVGVPIGPPPKKGTNEN